MKKRTIEKIITAKFNSWVKTIEDENVKKLVQDNTICCGGAIASMLLGGIEDVNDFDFYFTNKETTKSVAEYYVKKFLEHPTNSFKSTYTGEVKIGVVETEDRVKIKIQSAGVAAEGEGLNDYQYFEMGSGAEEFVEGLVANKIEAQNNGKDAYRPVFLSENAITLTDDIQLIFRFFGEPDQIFENYDFVHCCNYWSSKTGKVTFKPEALEAILTKTLIFVGSRYPICSLLRLRKFLVRGFTISAGQLLKIVYAIKELNLNDPEILREALTGCDVAYFSELLAKLKDKNPKVVDTAYLMTLIEEIFD